MVEITPSQRQRRGKPDISRDREYVAADGTVLLDQLSLAAFWGRVDVSNKFQCWEWQGKGNDKGYGRFRTIATHRLAYMLIHGPIPDDHLVRHRCDNPRCCSPHHLEVGTNKDNTQDALERGRFAMGNRYWNTKIPDEDIPYIRRNPDRMSLAALAERFGVTKTTIDNIRKGKSRNRIQLGGPALGQ